MRYLIPKIIKIIMLLIGLERICFVFQLFQISMFKCNKKFNVE